MFDSPVLEVAIGLAFLYLLLSLLMSVVQEWISLKFNNRAEHLFDSVRDLLPKDLFDQFYNHGLIKSLAGDGKGRPSYISSTYFCQALLDLLVKDPASKTMISLADLRKSIDLLPESSMKESLRSLVSDAGLTLTDAQARIGQWYNDAMDRAGGVFKRRSQQILLAASAVVIVAANVDTLAIAHRFWIDGALRKSVVVQAEAYARNNPPPAPEGTGGAGNSVELQNKMQALSTELGAFPLGLAQAQQDFKSGLARVDKDARLGYGVGWFAWKICGLAITVLAVSMGAPFWFDTMNKFINLRATGKKPNETAAS